MTGGERTHLNISFRGNAEQQAETKFTALFILALVHTFHVQMPAVTSKWFLFIAPDWNACGSLDTRNQHSASLAIQSRPMYIFKKLEPKSPHRMSVSLLGLPSTNQINFQTCSKFCGSIFLFCQVCWAKVQLQDNQNYLQFRADISMSVQIK